MMNYPSSLVDRINIETLHEKLCENQTLYQKCCTSANDNDRFESVSKRERTKDEKLEYLNSGTRSKFNA